MAECNLKENIREKEKKVVFRICILNKDSNFLPFPLHFKMGKGGYIIRLKMMYFFLFFVFE